MKKILSNKAFTLIELLIVIAIIGLLASILVPKLLVARAKADDVRRKAVLKNIQSQIIGDKADATTNFSDIFSSGSKAKDMLDTLISQTGVSSTDYDAKVSSDGTSYAVVFPLKADPTKYWCVDSTGVSKEVGGRLTGSGSLCAGATAAPVNAPVITLVGSNPDPDAGIDMPYYNVSSYIDPGYSAYDVEDGDITSQVIVTDNIPPVGVNGYGCITPLYGDRKYSVTDSSGNTTVLQRDLVFNVEVSSSCNQSSGGAA